MPDSADPRDWIVQLMNHVEGQVMFGDTKANQLLAADSILLAALAILAKDVRREVWAGALYLGAAAAFLLVVSLGIVLIAIAPAQRLLIGNGVWRNRLWDAVLAQSRQDRRPHAGDDASVVHFAAITALGPDRFEAAVSAATAGDLERDLLRTIYGKSQWAQHKFVWLDRAVKVTFVGLVLASLCGPVEVLHAAW